jgi:hypothetical protein
MRFILLLFISPLLASDVIELDKQEALAIMNLAFIARASQADAEEANHNFQVALRLLLKDNDVTLQTHRLNLLTGTLDPVGAKEVGRVQEDD